MNPQELTAYLHARIPLSKEMAVEVLHAEADGVRLAAPLAPNINNQLATVFGGSASALAILSAWTLLYLRLKLAGVEANIVIQSNAVRYNKPMAGAFEALALAPDSVAWDKFVNLYKRRGRARITLKSVLSCQGVATGELEGDFVVLLPLGH